MADTPDINRQLASAIAASSTRSPIEAGPPEGKIPDPDLIDAINQVFTLFRVNFHNQYFSAFGNNTESENIAKKLWLQQLGIFDAATICRAAEKIIADSDYLPTLHKMLNACSKVALPGGMPSSREAYIEACNAASPKVEQNWSHPAVYLAGRDCGWYQLSTQSETVALRQYSDIYNQYCQRVAAGEQLALEKPPQLEEKPAEPADKETARQQLGQLKQLFD